jgi:hypothetical protein
MQDSRFFNRDYNRVPSVCVPELPPTTPQSLVNIKLETEQHLQIVTGRQEGSQAGKTTVAAKCVSASVTRYFQDKYSVF